MSTSERWEEAVHRGLLAMEREWKANHNETPDMTADRFISDALQRETLDWRVQVGDEITVEYLDQFEELPISVTDNDGRLWRLCGCGWKGGPFGSGGPWRLCATYQYV